MQAWNEKKYILISNYVSGPANGTILKTRICILSNYLQSFLCSYDTSILYKKNEKFLAAKMGAV